MESEVSAFKTWRGKQEKWDRTLAKKGEEKAEKSASPPQSEAKASQENMRGQTRKFPCTYCGEEDHKSWNCPLVQKVLKEYRQRTSAKAKAAAIALQQEEDPADTADPSN